MSTIKRFLGFAWMLLALASFLFMVNQAATEIARALEQNRAVLDTRMFWYIIIPIFAPILAGLGLFGWYAWKGEY
jgi:ABC-type glycerol-3-phosphate transport system permease component